MSSAFQIRPISHNDFQQWFKLWEGYNAFYGRSGISALPRSITDVTWKRFLDKSEPVYGLVAESEGRLIGLAHYLFHRSTTALESICYLQDLFTDEADRGKGVGKALIDAVYANASSAGSSRVYWQTHETNVTAMKLYNKVAERSGFVVYRKQFFA